MRGLRQIEMRLWFDDADPVHDAPSETICVMQPTIFATIAFAGKVIARHWNGECACRHEHTEGACS